MKTFTFPSGKTVEIPSTGIDWELYTVSMGCARPARALTSSLERALKRLDRGCRDGYKPTENGVYEMIETYLRPVMVKWASFGTADTEPRCHAFAAIERAVRVLTGEGV
jgi:hypothetical protein